MRDVRQVPNDYFRRWFYDDNFDLVAWYKPDGSLHGFQLSYDKTGREKALTWYCDRGLSHHRVDSGETSPLENRTPILIAEDGRFSMTRVRSGFEISGEGLPPELRTVVLQKISEYGSLKGGPRTPCDGPR
jgi:hypothetical protein